MRPMVDEGPVRFVAITGMTGAGRRAAAHVLEDLGWYTVDNLPPSMLPQLFRNATERGITRVACILDVRTRSEFEEIPGAFVGLAAVGVVPQILFLTAADDVIVRRQEHVRRPHPLQGDGSMLDGIRRERSMLADLSNSADLVIDTSRLTVHQLGVRVVSAFDGGEEERLRVTVVSFGFKNGAPIDADVVLDVRFLPNPHWIPGLRAMSGLNPEVSGYVLGFDEAVEFLDVARRLFETMAPGYRREGKRHTTIAIGCTGGKHRSTAMAEALAERLREIGFTCTTVHRDLGLE